MLHIERPGLRWSFEKERLISNEVFVWLPASWTSKGLRKTTTGLFCTHHECWSRSPLSSGKRPSTRRWLGSSPWNTDSQMKLDHKNTHTHTKQLQRYSFVYFLQDAVRSGYGLWRALILPRWATISFSRQLRTQWALPPRVMRDAVPWITPSTQIFM